MSENDSGVPAHTPTDRELLELAAKAAGMPYPKWNEVRGYLMVGLGSETCEWNPLESDAHAFRLAVTLRIEAVYYCREWDDAEVVDCQDCREPTGVDPTTATRRAIVRAAAAIARATARNPSDSNERA